MFDFSEEDFKDKEKYIIHNMEQNSKEWFAVRLGKLTASNIASIISDGKTRASIIRQKAAEIITGMIEHKTIRSIDIDRGNELEPQARECYINSYGIDVIEVGFVELDSFVGVSPDGFASNDGLVEFKCPNDANFLKIVAGGKKVITKQYLYQMQMQMWVCDKKWCDYVIYNHNYKEKIFKIRIKRDESIIAIIKTAVDDAKKDIRKYIQQFNNNIKG